MLLQAISSLIFQIHRLDIRLDAFELLAANYDISSPEMLQVCQNAALDMAIYLARFVWSIPAYDYRMSDVKEYTRRMAAKMKTLIPISHQKFLAIYFEDELLKINFLYDRLFQILLFFRL